MKKYIEKKLKKRAGQIIKRQDVKVVAVTGSVGKTSAKDAIVAVLAQKFSVRGNQKNYNNEIGVPLTIIGAQSPGRSIFGWLSVLRKARRLARRKRKDYPQWLVLEMGADRPGDIEYLVNMAPPTVAVVTAVAPAHSEFLGDISDIAEEKGKLVQGLAEGGYAVLNGDDPYTRDMASLSPGKSILFGFGGNEPVRAHDISMDFPEQGIWPQGMRGILEHEGDWKGQFVVSGTVGRHSVYACMAAAGVGEVLDMSLQDILEGIRAYRAPAGRMRLLPGIKHTLLIDDSYNSSPSAAIAALETLAEIQPAEGAERYAVLGDMLELGKAAPALHAKVGQRLAELSIDFLITVGELAKEISKAAQEAGMSEHRIASFDTSDAAGRFLQSKMQKGDVILIKGSQGSRTEKITKEVMAEPMRAEELLVRMDKTWVDR